ncbi:hypothetical protein ABW19_dt0205486 [Dactylella cylindrospora]|nr:hypothetical protein ABW19_dt0205486 [Dactylella cylindrospora]
MSNYNPNYRRDTAGSPEYSRENSLDDVDVEPLSRGGPDTLQLPGSKPGGLSVSPPSSTAAYTPYYAAASPTTSPVNTRPNPPSPKAGDKSSYKAYRPPVQQAYSTDSVIPSQPHGPYTAYQPSKPVTTTQVPNVAPPKPQASPVISPLIRPVGQPDNRPISPPTQRLPSPLPTSQLAENFPAAAPPSSYVPPSVTDSIASTPSIYEHPQTFSKPLGQLPVASGPFTPQGTAYEQQPPTQQKPSYVPPKPTTVIPTHHVPSYGPPASTAAAVAPTSTSPSFTPQGVTGTGSTASPPVQPTGLSQGPPLDPQAPQIKYPIQPAGTVGPGYVDSNYHPYNQPVQPVQSQQPIPFPPLPSGRAYAVELPSTPDGPDLPPKPAKQLSFTLPPSDIYAERISNFMNMLEKEASLAPTAAPTLGQPEPEDLETRRNKVFKDWIISEAKLRGPKFATDLADDLDSLSFGSTRTSGQFSAKPRGDKDVYGYADESKTPQAPRGPPIPPKATIVDVTKLLPLLYPPPPPKVTAAAKLAPFQKTFSASANLSFIDKNRQAFVNNQTEMERKIQAEIDEVRRRRGKRNPQDAENVVREIRKREGLDAYERFDRDVVGPTYGELMKTAEAVDTVKQGVEDFVKDNAGTLTTSELLEVFSFLTAVQDFSTTVHNNMESLLTERSMKYMYSLTVPLYEANDAAEAKKIEAWNQSVVAGQQSDNKQAEEKRVGKYSKFVIEICDQAIAREKAKSAQLTSTLSELVRAIDIGLRDGGHIEFNIPQSEDIRPFDLSEEGKLLWLRSKILTAALAIQASMDSQKALQKTKDVASRLAIKARYAAQEADAIKQHPTNQQQNIEDINKLREQQAREIEELNRGEALDSETRGIERGRFEAIVRPAADSLKAQALTIGGQRAQSWVQDGREEVLLGWVR